MVQIDFVDDRPKCICCGRRWVPASGVDLMATACTFCTRDASTCGYCAKGSRYPRALRGRLEFTVRGQDFRPPLRLRDCPYHLPLSVVAVLRSLVETRPRVRKKMAAGSVS
jgi:hypothetical protein